MKHLYVEIFHQEGEIATVPFETVIILFAHQSCDNPPITVTLVRTQLDSRPTYNVNLGLFRYDFSYGADLPSPMNLCKLPLIIMHDQTTCVAGVCAVVRHLFKSADPLHPFLGFKQSCLYACAEASLWTKFCEIDMITTVNKLVLLGCSQSYEIPLDLARFEAHMGQPVRVHNIQKVKQDTARASGQSHKTEVHLDHLFAEGATPSIADIILFPAVHIIFFLLGHKDIAEHIPLVYCWYQRMMELDMVRLGLDLSIDLGKLAVHPETLYLPRVPAESLYKSDPKRYKPRHRIFTRQPDVENSLKIVEGLDIDILQTETFGRDIHFDWDAVPWEAQPGGGSLPAKRIERKSQQLENLARAILKIAKPGDRIVDFCAGSGHLGLIIAHSLPRCTIVLLENKEESLSRARERAKKLHLNNIVFCQSNVDYFIGDFEIGTSLHACGVATDLVLYCCINKKAAFVCCPCCYGSLQPNHIVRYPQSKLLRELPLSEREYLVLGHAADQTHDDANSKTQQGNTCMDIIDADRCYRAKEEGYWTCLSKLYPPSCTPKNNLIVGLPRSRADI